MKKLSIITINYNNRDGLRKTIESVVAQTTRDFEYIVIDGGSTDGSVDVIKEYASYIDYWVSEPDKGIYNAMNKGTVIASGAYCLYLNSGDWLYSIDTVERSLKQLDSDVILGITNRVYADGHEEKKREINSDVTCVDLLHKSINHQSSIIRTELCKKYPYDETFRICSDWKFFLTIFLWKNASLKVIDVIIVNYDMTGVSSVQDDLYFNERKEILYNMGLPIRVVRDLKLLNLKNYNILVLVAKYPRLGTILYGTLGVLLNCYDRLRLKNS